MAKILGPLHSDRVKGSISGQTFREYRGMSVIVRRPKPVARYRGPLSNNRSIFAYISKKWGLVDAADRLLWALYAAAHPRPNGMGGTFQLDGNQMYMSLNHTAIRLGGSVAEQAQPPIAEPPAVIDTLVAASGAAPASIDLTWTQLGTGVAADFCEVGVAGPFNSLGRMQVKSRFAYAGDVAGNALLFTVSSLQEGAVYWCRVRYTTADGQVSNWIYDQAVASVTP